jgi:two-component SAPR family response regulator
VRGCGKRDVKNADCSQYLIENKGQEIPKNRCSHDLYENKRVNVISQDVIENK